MGNDVLAATEYASRIDGLVGRRLEALYIEGTALFQRLETRTRTAKSSIHLVSSHAKDPDQERGLALEGRKRSDQGHEDFLSNVFCLTRIAKPLERKPIDAREIGFIKEIEMLLAPRQDLVHEFTVVVPGLLSIDFSLSHVLSPIVPESLIAGDALVDLHPVASCSAP